MNGKPIVEGSLLEWIDHTKTLFGKRMIRKWLLSPLVDPVKINERLDAVQDLRRVPEHVNNFRERIS
jgi:DNA mismatch repair ATPase MutS